MLRPYLIMPPFMPAPRSLHSPTMQPPTIDALQAAFDAERYVADRDLATAVYLSLVLDRPLLLEGEAGVGKTEVGRTLAAVLDTELIRLQCYEGLDVNTAVRSEEHTSELQS